VNGRDGTLDAGLARFVDHHVRSLVSWEILVFFDAHRGAVLDEPGLAKRLGRRASDVSADVDALCRTGVLQCGGGLIRFTGDAEVAGLVGRFAAACQDPAARKEILGRILPRLDAAARLQAQSAAG